MDLKEIITKQALKDADNLEVAFQTNQSYDKILTSIREDFISKLIKSIENKLKENYTEIGGSWIFTDESWSSRINLKIENSNWNGKYSISIADHDNDRLFFGIKANDDSNEKILKKHSRIREILNQGYVNISWWWIKTKPPYNTWDNNFESLKLFAFPDDGIALNYFTDQIPGYVYVIEKMRTEFISID